MNCEKCRNGRRNHAITTIEDAGEHGRFDGGERARWERSTGKVWTKETLGTGWWIKASASARAHEIPGDLEQVYKAHYVEGACDVAAEQAFPEIARMPSTTFVLLGPDGSEDVFLLDSPEALEIARTEITLRGITKSPVYVGDPSGENHPNGQLMFPMSAEAMRASEYCKAQIAIMARDEGKEAAFQSHEDDGITDVDEMDILVAYDESYVHTIAELADIDVTSRRDFLQAFRTEMMRLEWQCSDLDCAERAIHPGGRCIECAADATSWLLIVEPENQWLAEDEMRPLQHALRREGYAIEIRHPLKNDTVGLRERNHDGTHSRVTEREVEQHMHGEISRALETLRAESA